MGVCEECGKGAEEGVVTVGVCGDKADIDVIVVAFEVLAPWVLCIILVVLAAGVVFDPIMATPLPPPQLVAAGVVGVWVCCCTCCNCCCNWGSSKTSSVGWWWWWCVLLLLLLLLTAEPLAAEDIAGISFVVMASVAVVQVGVSAGGDVADVEDDLKGSKGFSCTCTGCVRQLFEDDFVVVVAVVGAAVGDVVVSVGSCCCCVLDKVWWVWCANATRWDTVAICWLFVEVEGIWKEIKNKIKKFLKISKKYKIDLSID